MIAVVALIICFLVWGLTFYLWDYIKDNDFFPVGLVMLSAFSMVVFVVVTVKGLILPVSGQTTDIQELRAFESKRIILAEQKKDLTEKFTQILAITYPNIEKDLFKDPGALVKAYPQIHSHETLMKLVDEINKLSSVLVKNDLDRIDTETRIRIRLNNPTYLTFLIPDK